MDYTPAVGVGGGGTDNIESLNNTEFDLNYKNKRYSPIQKVYVKKSYPNLPGDQNRDQPLEIDIPADPYLVTRLWTMKIGGRIRIEKKVADGDWLAITSTDNDWGLCNNYINSLFSRIDCTIGGSTVITDPGNCPYPYKTYMEMLFNYSKTYQDSILKHEGFLLDDYSNSNQLQGNKSSWFKRRDLFKTDGNYIDFYVPLRTDINSCKKVLPPGYSLKFNFVRNADNFVIWKKKTQIKTGTGNETALGYDNNSKYRIAFEEKSFYLEYERFQVDESITNNYKKILNESDKFLSIPITRSILRSYTVSNKNGVVDFGMDNWISNSNHLPSQVILCFIENGAYQGNDTKDPFYMEHIDFTEACLVVNSIQEPLKAYKTANAGRQNLAKNFFFTQMREIGHISELQFESSINYDNYFKNCFFLAFDRSPSKDNSFFNAKHDKGNLSLTLNVTTHETQPKNDYRVLALLTYSSHIALFKDSVQIERF